MPPVLDADRLNAAIPPLSGTLNLAGFRAEVTVYRDSYGVPHIKAHGEDDAYMALGFVHAQDRLFQMDLTRRKALGRAAEWLGTEAATSDILVRKLGLAAACQRDYAALSPEAQRMLQSYSHGVNAFLESGTPMPVEYALLQATADRWEPWHSIAVMRRLGLLMGSVWFKLWRMLALPIVGPENAAKLRYDDAGEDLLCIPPGASASRYTADLAALSPSVEALLQAMGDVSVDGTGGGSNNWAVGPERSATGRPILAGDPHRVFEIPGMYAQHHLACDAFDMIGLTVPGVPGFPHFAHNGRVAYCVTHAFVDIHDLYLEQLEAGGRMARVGDDFEPTRIRSDSIRVRGEADRPFDIIETRNGPVIAGDPASSAALTLRSVQFAETDLSFDCLPRMAAAGTVAELYEATRGWGLIDHNLVAGDTSGAIGHQVRARVPKRPRENGWLPMPGWLDRHQWQGWISHEEMPCIIDPPGSIIVTANNRVVGDGHPHYLCTDCHPPYRAQRILHLLKEKPFFDVPDAVSIHADTFSPHRALFHGHLSGLPALDDPAQDSIRRALLDWDGWMDAGSSGATAYNCFRRALTRLVATRSGLLAATCHPWSAVPPVISPETQVWWALPKLLRDNDLGFLDGWTWAQAFAAAISEAARQPSEKAWGQEHQPRFMHPLAGAFAQYADLLNPASRPIGGDGDTVLATGLVPSEGPTATYGALSRYVFDVGNWDNSRWVVFHGASGHPGSPHYVDQNASWSACEMVPMRYAWDGIIASAQTVQRLVPA